MGISKYAPVEDHEAKSNPHPQYALASQIEAVRASILAVKTSIRTVTNEITNTTTTPLAIGDPVAESVIGGILFVGANNLLAQDASLAWDFTAKTLTLPNAGLHILDTNASHDLIIKPGSDLTSDRILTLTTGDAARTITLSGDTTLADWFDQSVKTAASPTFANATISTEITLANSGLHILDTNSTHDLIVTPGSNLTADRILTIITGDAARSITLNGNPTLNDWFDQSVKAAASPTFAALTTTGASGIEIAEDSGITLGSAGDISNTAGIIFVNGVIDFTDEIRVGGDNGATGTFTTVDLKTITVTNGIITTIV